MVSIGFRGTCVGGRGLPLKTDVDQIEMIKKKKKGGDVVKLFNSSVPWDTSRLYPRHHTV